MVIFTDGSAHPNPGPGGYGVVIYDDNNNLIDCYTHQENYTTNNIQEIKAVLYVMLNYGKHYNTPIVYCDSSYVVNTMTQWMFSWANKGWIKSDNKPPENLDLIKEYYNLYNQGYRINLQKVKGHNNILGNELADMLATNRITTEEVIKKYGK